MTEARNPSHAERIVHVAGLHKQVKKDALLSALGGNEAGVENIKIAKDLLSNQSLGHARVTFASRAAAEHAITSLNKTLLHDQPIQLTFYRSPSERVRYADECKVFIKGISREVTDGSLFKHLEIHGGPIISCKISRDADGVSRGYGTSVYASKEAASKAVSAVNGTTLSGGRLVAKPYSRPYDVAAAQPSGDSFTNLYVNNIDAQLTDRGLQQLFQKFGAIKNAKVMVDATGESLGYGFVSFANHSSAARAVEAFKSSKMYVGPAQSKLERQKERARELQASCGVTRLIVQNLADTVTTDELRQRFSKYGTVTFAKVIVDDTGLHRGYGFVHFNDPEAASRALAAFDTRQDSKWFVGPLAKKKLRLTRRTDFNNLQPPIDAFDGHYFPPRTRSPSVRRTSHRAIAMQQFLHDVAVHGQSGSGGDDGLTQQPPSQQTATSPRLHAASPPRQDARSPSRARQTPSPRAPRNRNKKSPGRSPAAAAPSPAAAARATSTGRPAPAAMSASRAAAVGAADARAELQAVEAQLAAAAGDDAKRQVVGNWIYPSLWERHGQQTAKVVGMLLALDMVEVLTIFRDRAAMFAKAQEAAEVWQLYNEQRRSANEGAALPAHRPAATSAATRQ